MNLELRSLRHVVTLARHANYRRAAEELGISQSTLTRSIQTVEEKLQNRLFDRDRATVRLTALGREFVAHAQAVLLSAEDMSQALARAAGDEHALAFGVGPLVAKTVLPDILREQLSNNPDFRVTVTLRNAGELMPLLLAEQIEFFVAAGSQLPVPARVRASALAEFPISLLVRPEHPLVAPENRAPGAAPFPLIASSVRELPHHFPEALRSRISPTPSVVTDDHQLLSLLAQTTDAVWLSSAFAAHAEIEAGKLIAFPMGPDWRRTFPVVTYALQGHPHSSAAAKLLAAIRTRIRRVEAALQAGVMHGVDQKPR
jgi:DNA-binding transcriptional LysR family regulator